MFRIDDFGRFMPAAMMGFILSNSVLAGDPIIPQSWVDACIEDRAKCDRVEKELRKLHEETEAECAVLTDLGDRKDLIEILVSIEALRELLGFDPISVLIDLCADTLNPEITNISFQPGEALDLSIGDEVEFTATINCMTCYKGICLDTECEGKLSWFLGGTDVAELSSAYKNKATITAVGPGFDAIAARSLDIPDIYDTAQISVEDSGVDIVLVAQSENGSYYQMGFETWECPANLCLIPEGFDTSWTRFIWWIGGAGFPPGTELPYKVKMYPPGRIGVSLSPDGPFEDGPLDVNFVVSEHDPTKAWSPQIHLKALSVGTAEERVCPEWFLGYCDPESYWTRLDVWEVGPEAFPRQSIPKGLRYIGSEIALDLANRFGVDDFRFSFIGFGQYPTNANCYGNLPEWKPYLEPTPYHRWFDLTSDREAIGTSLSNIRLICSYPVDGTQQGSTVYSAILHAVQDSDWKEEATKFVIVFSTHAACEQSGCDIEWGSGYTSTEVINAANDAGVTIISLSAGSDHLASTFQTLADGTGGIHFSARMEMQDALELAFDAIEDSRAAESP